MADLAEILNLTDPRQAAEVGTGIFVDWLSMAQTRPEGGLPVINGGGVVSIDENGSIEYQVDKFLPLEGSYSTKLHIRCDGYTVEASGNIGRWNRPDNVFGYTYEECVARWNRVLYELFGLPPFLPGRLQIGGVGKAAFSWTGAVNRRIDLTRNYAFESADDLQLYLTWLGTQQTGRTKVGVDASRAGTVTWGEGSKYIYAKFYDKAREMTRHEKKADGDPHFTEVLQLLQRHHVGRFEIELKSRFLTQNRLRYLGETSMEKLVQVFRHRAQCLVSEGVAEDGLKNIPNPYYGTAKRWAEGGDPRSFMSERTFRRHRSYLKKHFGLDIAVPCNVKALSRPVKVIKVAALDAPQWYRDQMRRCA